MTPIKTGLPIQQPQQPDDQGRNPQVMNAAKMYENQFLREMVKAMRQTVPENEVTPPSMGEKIFRNQLDDQYVDDWVEQGGVGFADVIYKQVMERYMNPPTARPQGPLRPDSPETRSKPIKLETKDMTLKIQTSSKTPTGLEVLAPWGGQILMSRSLEPGLQTILIDHGQGLKSSLVYKGWIGATEGSMVGPGQKLGGLSAQNPELLWRIQEKV